MKTQRIVIVGGGFGGLEAALTLGGEEAEVTLVDRRNFHLFQPLLYQVASGGLSPANIAAPLRAILKAHKNVRVLMAEVRDVDVAAREVRLADGVLPYDALIVAAGACTSYFGHPEWEAFAPGLKTVEDATEIRAKILGAFEAAERETDAARRDALLRLVVVGGGATGVELAGAIAEIARYTLREEFRAIRPEDANIVLVEAGERLLPGFAPELSASAERELRRMGVVVRTRTSVTDVRADHLDLRGPAGEERIAARTIIWAAGVRGAPLGETIARQTGAVLDRGGRVPVERDLTISGHPEIAVIGDLCRFEQDGQLLPGLGAVALQQGTYAGNAALARLRGSTPPPFRYADKGIMATIGRKAGIVQMGRLRFEGFWAWVVWLFVHLMLLVMFSNRLQVLLQWAWSYLTFARSARLITWMPVERTAPSETRDG